MDVSAKAKERFCKDCNIPIRLFKEPYFTDRIKLYDRFYGTIVKWDIFLNELEKYKCEQDYFEDYNLTKDTAILNIKNSEAYQRFNEEDMNKYSIENKGFPNKDIFKSTNDGKFFISIDMRKANFSALYHYSEDMFKDVFGAANTWEEFIGKFTENKHIINSKYIRQVILGNCNPKRQVTYEKYLMDQVLSKLLNCGISADRIVFFSNDEIVIDISDMGVPDVLNRRNEIFCITNQFSFPLKVELFKLHKIYGTDGYYKEIFNGCEKEIEFKCLDSYMLPFVIRKFIGDEITESDKVFYHEGLLAQFIEVPNIEVNLNEN